MADKKTNSPTTTQKGYESSRTVGLKKDYKVTGKVDPKKASK